MNNIIKNLQKRYNSIMNDADLLHLVTEESEIDMNSIFNYASKQLDTESTSMLYYGLFRQWNVIKTHSKYSRSFLLATHEAERNLRHLTQAARELAREYGLKEVCQEANTNILHYSF